VGRAAPAVEVRGTAVATPTFLPDVRTAPLDASTATALQRTAGNQAVTTLVQRKRSEAARVRGKGLARYASEKLVDRLRAMQAKGTLAVGGTPIPLTEEDLFVLDAVARVETGGGVNALNTWDDMIVSLGFKQVTLVHGSLFKVMRMAPNAFAAHGLTIGSGTWTFKTRSGPATTPTIAGCDDPQELRRDPWATRFWEAGLEDEAVAAVTKYAMDEIGAFEKKVVKDSKGQTNPWMQDPTVRAILIEAYNNRPAFARTAARKLIARTAGQKLGRDEFLDALGDELKRAYSVRNEEVKAERIIKKVPRDPKLGPTKGSQAAKAKAPAQVAPANLSDVIAALLPAAMQGAGALERILGGLGLDLGASAVEHLVAAGVRDASKLTNVAFWVRHPELTGTMLQPAQPNFAALSKEWLALRDGLVARALRRPAAEAASTAGAGSTAEAGSTPAKVPVPGRGPTAPDAPDGGKDPAFIKDVAASAIDLLPAKQRARFQAITWGWLDFPGGQKWARDMTPEVLAKYRTDASLVEKTTKSGEIYFVGKHQADAEDLFKALAAAGAGERRVNTGTEAVLIAEGYRLDPAAFDKFLVDQLESVPGEGKVKMHKEAKEAFVKMRAAAKADGVALNIGNAYRSRESEAAGAARNTNRKAFGAFSPHSMGLAMDLDLHAKGDGLDFGEQQTLMSKLPNMMKTAAYKWMYAHGASFNFYQYRAEPWHWEYNPPGFKDRFFATDPDLAALAKQAAEEKFQKKTKKKAAAKKSS
jgi:hypothetical protein